MSIDRIGKGPSPAGVSPTSTSPSAPVGRAAETGATFDISGGAATSTERAGAAASTEATSPAARVRSGELTIDQYLEQRVAEATQHLEGKIPPAKLSEVQSMLRSQLQTDPTLIEMVQAATGVAPPTEGE